MEEARDAKHHQTVLLNSIGFVNSYKITVLVVNLQYSEGKDQVNGIEWQTKQTEAKRDRKEGKAECENRGILSLWKIERNIFWEEWKYNLF